MAVRKGEGWNGIGDKVGALFADFERDLQEVGEVAADEIVRATLAGLGEFSVPFKPYSKGYKELIESVGGKPNGVVNLRGLFWHDQKKKRRVSKTSLSKGGGRRAYIWVNVGGRRFLARTKITRPQRGLIDPDSEMSRDLIEIKVVAKDKIKLIYRPRKPGESYMIDPHQQTRKWFTIERQSVRAAIVDTMRRLLEARVLAFNQQR